MGRWPHTLPVASLALNADAMIVDANSMAEDVLGTSTRHLQGQDFARFVPEGPDLLHQARVQGGLASAAKLTLIDSLGRKSRISAYISVDETGAGTLVLIPLAQEDMGARASALKHQAGTISAMNAMLAHEIKNPLAAIRGAAQLLSGEGQDLARLIISESDRIRDLIDKMQLFTSLEEIGDRACNVHTVLGEVLEGIGASVGQNHRLVPDYDPSLPQVQGNANVLHRVLTNLIKNACEACGDSGGHIQIKTRYTLSEKRPLLGGRPQAHLPISISIIDNGHGVAEDMVESIFNAFISTKTSAGEGGRGLGLAYVAQAVADMGGVIELETDPGRTQFQLRLPAVLDKWEG